MKAAIALLVCVCLGISVAWHLDHRKATEQRRSDITTILSLSNQWLNVRSDLDKQQKDNIRVTSNLVQTVGDLGALSNQLDVISADLSRTQAERQAALEEIKKRDSKIAELETQREGLTKQMVDLNSSISNLETQIADTERKLSDAEGDREFLLKELKRLQEEKAALERQFNDLAVLREQVRKLRDELSVERRMAWMRRGLYGITGRGGATLLQSGIPAPPPRTNYNLEVEIRRDNDPRIAPGATNSGATKN